MTELNTGSPPRVTATSTTHSHSSEVDAVIPTFLSMMEKEPDKSEGVAAIEILTDFVRNSKAETHHRFFHDLETAICNLKSLPSHEHLPSLRSACELFLRAISRSIDISRFSVRERKRHVKRAERFAADVAASEAKVAELIVPWLKGTMLVHAPTPPILNAIIAVSKTRPVTVWVTEGRPQCSGFDALKHLEAGGLTSGVSLVADAAVAYLMSEVSFVLVGAQGIVENGGVLNILGTFQIALIAQALRKPFYVATESYKFVREFPLGQQDVQQPAFTPQPRASRTHTPSVTPTAAMQPRGWEPFDMATTPYYDFTPPHLVSLLFTDLGILTPPAVSDELIKLYL